jgi:hypothetical protein
MKRKTNGSSRWLLLALLCVGGAVWPVAQRAVAQKTDRRATEPHAVVAGTVFLESGLSLQGAEVTLMLHDSPKGKKLQATSDARGEFAFRVPPSPAAYVVRASLKGFQTAEKDVSVSGEERVDINLVLEKASK